MLGRDSSAAPPRASVASALAKQCIADNEACTQNEECCGGACTDGKCVPLSGACKTTGNPCAGNGDCCSKFCKDGLCTAPSFCTQTGDACSSDIECCGGSCKKAAGAALGICAVAAASGAGGCTNAGEVCGGGAIYDGGALPPCGGECCSRSCLPFAKTGVFVCQPPSGCHPTGEICREDKDCCGSATQPDGDEVEGRLQQADGSGLRALQSGQQVHSRRRICRLQTRQCNASADCCAGNVLQKNTCKQDSLGIPRCLIAERDCATADPASFNGKACASSADCCGMPCVPNPSGTPPLVCNGGGGTKCVPSGGACTTTADCCAGLPATFRRDRPPALRRAVAAGEAVTPPCSAYGQQCSATQPCCNGVPCTNGYCVAEVIVK